MKTKLLLAALYFSFQGLAFGQCPAAGYTCIPDSNFEQALIDSMREMTDQMIEIKLFIEELLDMARRESSASDD